MGKNRSRLLFLVMCAMFLILFTACSNEDVSAPEENEPSEETSGEEQQPAEPEPEPAPEPEPEPAEPAQPEPSTDPKNIALASNGTTVEVDSLYDKYGKEAINDGYRVEDFLGPHDVAWASSLEGDNHWVEFTFPEPKVPHLIDIYWGEEHASQEIEIQVEQEGEWVTVHTWTNDEGNMLMSSMEIEEPVETTKLRIFQDKDKGPKAYRDPNIFWLSEVEIYEPDGPIIPKPSTDPKNIALASNGTTVEVDSVNSDRYTKDPINDGYRNEEFLTWDEVAWASSLEGEHWAELTFPEPKTPRQVDIYWGEEHASKEIQIQVLKDNDWVTVHTWTNDDGNMVMSTHEIEEPIETTKLRIFQEKDKGPVAYKDPNILWLTEVEVYE